MIKIAVYCGARNSAEKRYNEDAYSLGQAMAKHHAQLVYGGGSSGLMGAVANGVLDNGGSVLGVIPERLKTLELEHLGISETITTETMSERKVIMENNADAFIAMPGGIGTLDELFQVMADYQLGYHQKPIGILNTLGYFDALLQAFESFIAAGFIPRSSVESLLIETDPQRLIEAIIAQSTHA